MAKKDEGLRVEYVNIGELQEYEGNAKLHPQEQIEQIAKSIKQFGMNDPIAVWKDNVIIEGHGRLLACRQLGFETVPIIRLDRLTDAQRKAYTLAHNKLTMNSGFDMEKLEQELDDLSGMLDFDMSEFGFALGGGEDTQAEGGNAETGFKYREQYAVTVICEGEEEQREVYEKLTGEGYECRVVVV